MIRKHQSYFKDAEAGKTGFEAWSKKLEQANGYSYEKKVISTSLGDTQIYGFNLDDSERETIVIFPGFRTTTLIWDLDQGLKVLAEDFRVIMVETNGQPNLSEGYSPSIKSLEYGEWGAEVFGALQLDSAYIAGASFGGLVCMKIALVIPEKIKGAFLLNPGCFRLVSMGFKNLYYNLLPVFKPSRGNIEKFLDTIIFSKPNQKLSQEGESLLIDYLEMAIVSYKDNTEKPYYMGKQLDSVKVRTYLLVGDKDILIPYEKSVKRAQKHLGESLKEVVVYPDVAHGIECYAPAIEYLKNKMLALA